MNTMKQFLIFCLSIFSLSCVKNNNSVDASSVPSSKNEKTITQLSYYYDVRSADELRIHLMDGQYTDGTLYVQRNDSLVAMGTFSVKPPDYGMKTGIIKHPFGNDTTTIVLTLTRSGTDTLFRFVIPKYIHRYVDLVPETKLVEFPNTMFSWSLTPDNSTLFYITHPSDGVSQASLYSYTFATNTNHLITNSFDKLKVRGLNDHTVLTLSSKIPDKNGLLPIYSGDSVSLCAFDTEMKSYKFIAFVSNDYNRMTEVVRDHLVVNAPYFSKGLNARIVDLSDYSVDSLTINWLMLAERTRDNFWLGNYLLDEKTASVKTLPFSTREDFSIVLYDAVSEFTIGVVLKADSLHQVFKSGLQVYHQNSLVYSEPDTSAQVVCITAAGFNGSKVYYFRTYTDEHRSQDGLYEVDLTTKTRRLIKTEASSFSGLTWISAKEFIVIKNGALYKYTLPN